MSSEVSSIKPAGVKQREAPRFTYNNQATVSYKQEGFEIPLKAPDRKQQVFLSRVDLKKGKIKVKVRTMVRQMAIDYSTEKQEKKEYLTWLSDWSARDYQEVPFHVRSHIEGFHYQQTKEMALKWNPQTGENEPFYQKAAPVPMFTIPFSPKKVEEILNSEHPLGEDSENITNIDDVIYYGKFDNVLGIQSFRCKDYTHEQFVTPKWNDFVELAIRPGGPASRLPVKHRPEFIS